MIRFLGPDDADAFVALRARSLREEPWSFESSPGDDRMSDPATVRQRLAPGSGTVVAGVFRDRDLVGIAGLFRERHQKCAHKAHVWGMFVTPEERGHGLGERLLRLLVLRARGMDGIEDLQLGVSDEAPGARRLYERAGFTAWGIEPDALRLDGRSVPVACLSRPLPAARVTAVSRGTEHGLRKSTVDDIRLLAGLGVEGDAHMGETVRHRSRAAKFPDMPNLRQVHLIAAELHDELCRAGLDVAAGQMAENVTTRGLDLLDLPVGTRLALGDDAVVEATGLRNPCKQLDGLRPGLMDATLARGRGGEVLRRAGIMTVVIRGGIVRPGDAIGVELPDGALRDLEPV